MSFTVRPVSSADAPALAALLNAVIRAGGTTALEEEFTPGALDQTYLTGPTVHCCHVAQDAAGELAAFQTLGRYPGLPEDVGDIATFAAIERKQGGAGSALFAATKDRARQLGLSAINATIRADNTGGLAFYTKQGFTDHGVTRAVPLKDGTPVDRVHKRFVLNSPQNWTLRDQAKQQNSPPLQGRGKGWGLSANRMAEIAKFAREMRRNPTEPELHLWRALSNRQLGGFKFRRQTEMGPFIVDFFCPQKALAIEVDGETHDIEHDLRRDAALHHFGVKVLHFTNPDVMGNRDGVLTAILGVLHETPDRWERPHPNPSPKGEGLMVEN